MRTSPPIHRSTRVTYEGGETVAEVWVATDRPCPWCSHSETWASARPQVGYRICLRCRRGWERQHEPHTPDNNDALAQIVEQLARA